MLGIMKSRNKRKAASLLRRRDYKVCNPDAKNLLSDYFTEEMCFNLHDEKVSSRGYEVVGITLKKRRKP